MSVVVVGSVNRDVVARVVRIPGAGETVLASGLARTGGGKGANQAVAAARAGGAAVAFVGFVGDDADGEALRAGLAADGIDVAGLDTVEEPTGTAFISVAEDGENAIVVVPGANAARDSLSVVQRDLVRGARALVTQFEVPLPLVLDAARARSPHAWHILNAAPSGPLADAADEVLADVLATVDVLVVNQHEALDLARTARIEDAVAELSARVPVLVITLGADGCLVLGAGERRQVDAFPARAIDTTGAGDTFCGVFAASLAAGGAPDRIDIDALAQAARAGAAAAALAVGRPGAQEAVPTAGEVTALLSRAREAGAER